MGDMALPDMTAQELLAAAQYVAERMPDARLAKNGVGNLAILDTAGEIQHGYVDLRFGEVTFYADDDASGED